MVEDNKKRQIILFRREFHSLEATTKKALSKAATRDRHKPAYELKFVTNWAGICGL